jgi:hypothetical protein
MLLHVSGVGLSDNIGLRGPEIAITQSRLSVPYSSQATQPALVRDQVLRAARLRERLFLLDRHCLVAQAKDDEQKPSDDPAD